MVVNASSPWTPGALEAFLRAGKDKVDALLQKVVPRPEDHGFCPDVPRAMRHALFSGGKRLRPILILATADVCSRPETRVRELAIAVELIHTCSLVLDDLPAMDDASLRRGHETVHRVYGESIAILAANALLMLSFEQLALASASSRTALELVGRAARTVGVAGMIGGQAADLGLMREGVDLQTVEFIHAHKTGVLFTLALEGAAIACEASEAERVALAAYARNLGLAFQITDDLLDVLGTEDEVGKDLGKDRGKTTFVDLGGVDEAREVVDELVDTAVASLALFDRRADPLRAVAEFVRHRRY